MLGQDLILQDQSPSAGCRSLAGPYTFPELQLMRRRLVSRGVLQGWCCLSSSFLLSSGSSHICSSGGQGPLVLTFLRSPESS